MMIAKSRVEWIIKNIDTGHSPQLVEPEKLVDMLVELGEKFEKL